MKPRSSVIPGVTAAALASGAARLASPATQAHQRQRSATITTRTSQAAASQATSKVTAGFDSVAVDFRPRQVERNPFTLADFDQSAPEMFLDALLVGLLLVGIVVFGAVWIGVV